MAREASSPEPLFLAINSTLTWTAADVSVSLSRKSYLTDDAVWFPADAATGGVTVPMGPGSTVGQLDPGTWWAHVWITTAGGSTKFLAGPFVIVGGDSTYTPPVDELILDGGAP